MEIARVIQTVMEVEMEMMASMATVRELKVMKVKGTER